MSVRRVVELDFDEISTWFYARESKMPHQSLFPKTGFIINGIAAGFIYFTDSSVAIIDCFISNPATDSKTRSDALDQITDALIKCAKFHRCQVIKCDTQLEAIKLRAKRYGFKAIGSYDSFVLEM